jgi:hypothetical protein
MTKISDAFHHLRQKTHNSSEAESVSIFKLERQKRRTYLVRSLETLSIPRKKDVVNTLPKTWGLRQVISQGSTYIGSCLVLIHLKIGTAPSSETFCGFQPKTMDNDQNFSHTYEHIAFSKSLFKYTLQRC